MKAKKQQIAPYARLEKILTIAGVAIVIIGCIANLYGAYANRRFIHNPTDPIYYFRYCILLGGGFTIGFLLSGKAARRTWYNQLFIGVCYAVLATTLCSLLYLIPGGLRALGVSPAYPWSNLIFTGLPLLAIAAVLLVDYFTKRRRNRTDLSRNLKIALIVSFVVSEVYLHVSSAYYLSVGTAKLDPSMPLWSVIGNYLITPLVIVIVSYLLFKNIQSRFDRLFYATLIGALFSVFTIVLWEFRTEPSLAATNIFSNGVKVITLLFVGVLIWRARKAINSKTP